MPYASRHPTRKRRPRSKHWRRIYVAATVAAGSLLLLAAPALAANKWSW